jgi:hypothetical protein
MECIFVIEALQPGQHTREALRQIAYAAGAATLEVSDDAGKLHVFHGRQLGAMTAVTDALAEVAGNDWPAEYLVHPSRNRPGA